MIALCRIAADLTLSKAKCAYVVKNSIAPWLKENLQISVLQYFLR